jgi:hypothetical protein
MTPTASRKPRWQWLATLAVALLFVSCGGGGSSGSSSTATKYTSVAMAGELLDYVFDPVNLVFSYTIIESQFGLAGITRSGTLVRNGDGTFSPVGMPFARVFVLPNGLLIGAVHELFGTVPIIGLANPVSSLSAIAGNYNFVQRSCGGGACGAGYGSFAIDAGGSWTACPSNNLGGGSCPGAASSGTLVSLGGGLWQVMQGSVNIGTAIGFNSGAQNVLILDLKDTRVGGFGVGILVGAQQATMTTTQTDGTWLAGSTTGDWAVFTASGSSITVNSLDGIALNLPPTSFTANLPWQGMATTQGGGVGLLAGAGVYVLATAGGNAELGIKIR